MLVQLAVENFLSFRDEVVLSARAHPDVPHDPRHVVRTSAGLELLRVLAIYGANASGKSNLVKALEFVRGLVVEGTKPGAPLKPPVFRPGGQERPTRFELCIIADGRVWSYGFTISAAVVEGEWLYEGLGEEQALVFERGGVNGAGPTMKLGAAFTQEQGAEEFTRFVAQGTRPNQLFLFEALDHDVVPLRPVSGWFQRSLAPPRRDTTESTIERRLWEQPALIGFSSDLLRRGGTGVVALELSHEPVSDVVELEFHHNSIETSFKISEESEGTRELLRRAPMLHELRQRDGRGVWCIDELERSLHPNLTRFLVMEALSAPPESQGQLIFTTHDTGLLDRRLLPEDAVWFVKKDAEGGTALYSLAEYKAEQLDALGPSLERGYLQGRFGAVPFPGDLRHLGWLKDEG